jgi:hypothetical protein
LTYARWPTGWSSWRSGSRVAAYATWPALGPRHR